MEFKGLKQNHPKVYENLMNEIKRQNEHIELIASENFVSEDILEALVHH